jgi:hypothetical protein
MKVVLIHNRFKRPVLNPDGSIKARYVFQWYRFERGDNGWTLRLLSFLSHITDDLEWTGHTGVINIGWHGKLVFSFVPGVAPLITWGE